MNNNNKTTMIKIAKVAALSALVLLAFAMPCMAEADAAVNAAYTGITSAVRVLLTAIGAIFIVVGLVRFVLAHSQEDSPSQQKAAMMIATGIAAIVFGFALSSIISGDTFKSMINTTGTGS